MEIFEPKQGPPTEGKNEVEMTPAEGIAATVLEIIRLEGELNWARATSGSLPGGGEGCEKKRLAQLRNLDISSIEATGDSQPHPVSGSWRFVAVRVTSHRWGFILVPVGGAVSSARRPWRLVAVSNRILGVRVQILEPVVKRARSTVIEDVAVAQPSEPRGNVEDFLQWVNVARCLPNSSCGRRWFPSSHAFYEA